jgi:hypothetical protein
VAFGIVIGMDAILQDINRTVPAHPTFRETIQNAP